MAGINRIIIPLLPGIKDKYDVPENGGMFDSDRLVLHVLPEDYNAPNPVVLETQLGYSAPFTKRDNQLYKPEFVDRDRRCAIKRYVMRDLLLAGGNLSLYGVTDTGYKNAVLIAIEDYHELDLYEDELQGFTLRIGTANVESLKGSYRQKNSNYNYNNGLRIKFCQTHRINQGILEPYIPTI